MGSNLQIVINGVDQASDTFGNVGNAMDNLTGKAGGLLSKGLGPLQSMLGTGLKVAAGVAATAVGGLAAGLVSSVSDAADFQQGMADIQASMGASAEDTAKLKDLILDLGIDPGLKVSAEEAAQAIGQLGTAGVSVDDILKGTARSTVLLANATGADFADAASMASDVSKLWAIDAGDLTHAVNGITAATVASKFNINDYKLALAQAGGVASTVGVSFDDFNTTIAAISPSFASGSDAGTSFKVFLQRLIPQSNTARDAMRDLGLFTGSTKEEFQDAQAKIEKLQIRLSELNPTSKTYAATAGKLNAQIDALRRVTNDGSNAFFDANGNMKSMADIVGVLNKAFTGLTEEQKNQYLSTIFGTDAMRAAAAMAKMTTGDFKNLADTMGKTDAAESAKTRMDTLKGSLEILSGTFDTLKLMIGDKFLPVLNDLVKRFNDFLGAQAPMIVEWAGALAAKLGDLVGTYLPVFITKLGEWWNWAKQLAVTLVDVGNQVWNFITGVKAALQPVIDFVTRFVGLKEILLGVAAAFGVAAVASLATFVASLAPVLALLGTAVLVVTTLRNAWGNDFGGIRETVTGVLDYLRDRFGALWDFIKLFGPGALKEIADWVNGNETQFNNLGKIWTQVKVTAQALFNDLIAYVRNSLPGWIANLQALGAAAWQWIINSAPIALSKLAEWGAALFSWIIASLPNWIAQWLTWSTAMWQWIGDNIPKAIDKLTQWVNSMSLWASTGEGNTKMLEMFGALSTTMLEALGKIGFALAKLALVVAVDLLTALGQGLLNWMGINVGLTQLKDNIVNAITGWVPSFNTSGAAIMEGLRNGILGAKDLVRNGFDLFMDFMQQGRDARLGPFGQSLYDAGANAVSRLGQGFQAAKDAVTGQFNQVMTDVQNQGLGFAGGALLGRMYEGGRSFLLKVSEGINSAAPDLKNDINNAFTGLLNSFNYWHDNLAPHFLGSAKDLIANVVNGLSNSNLGQALGGAFNALLNAYNKWHDDLSPHFFASAKDLASSLINGLTNGIIDGIGKVIGAIQGVTDALPQWVKDKLGIHSPSTVFAGLGQNIIEGLVQGMQSMAGAPQAVLSDMTAGMTAGAGGGTNMVNSNNTSTTHQWNVNLPGAGGNQPTDQMRSTFNLLTTLYAVK